jgi:hypothetical protein
MIYFKNIDPQCWNWQTGKVFWLRSEKIRLELGNCEGRMEDQAGRGQPWSRDEVREA